MAEKKYVIDNAELMAEWDWEKNNEFGFDPHKITLGSDKRVFWKCKNGHSWQTSVRPRVIENTKCPYCSGKKPVAGVNDLGTTHPELCLEWNYEKNIAISPSSVSKASTKKISEFIIKPTSPERSSGILSYIDKTLKFGTNNCPKIQTIKAIIKIANICFLFLSHLFSHQNTLRQNDEIKKSFTIFY